VTTYELASRSGLLVGFSFFLLLSGCIAFAMYALMTWPSARRTELGLGTIRKSVAAPIALVIWIAIFSMIYFSSLDGFYSVTVGDNDIRIDYVVPPSSVPLRYSDIREVARRPAHRLQWRLVISMSSGATLESAAGSQRLITEAAEEIERRRRAGLTL
jgi:hypothetical protein